MAEDLLQTARQPEWDAARTRWATLSPVKYREVMYGAPRTSVRFWLMFIPCVQHGVEQDVINQAAAIAAQSERDGAPVGAWHAVAVVQGLAPSRCPCANCRKQGEG